MRTWAVVKNSGASHRVIKSGVFPPDRMSHFKIPTKNHVECTCLFSEQKSIRIRATPLATSCVAPARRGVKRPLPIAVTGAGVGSLLRTHPPLHEFKTIFVDSGGRRHLLLPIPDLGLEFSTNIKIPPSREVNTRIGSCQRVVSGRRCHPLSCQRVLCHRGCPVVFPGKVFLGSFRRFIRKFSVGPVQPQLSGENFFPQSEFEVLSLGNLNLPKILNSSQRFALLWLFLFCSTISLGPLCPVIHVSKTK